MIVAGTLTYKMALRLKRLYNQMPRLKQVMVVRVCAAGGAPTSSPDIMWSRVWT